MWNAIVKSVVNANEFSRDFRYARIKLLIANADVELNLKLLRVK
jgi:hypothetical protein